MSNQEDAKEEDVSGEPSLPSLPLPIDPTSALTSSGKREPGDLPRELTCRPLGNLTIFLFFKGFVSSTTQCYGKGWKQPPPHTQANDILLTL